MVDLNRTSIPHNHMQDDKHVYIGTLHQSKRKALENMDQKRGLVIMVT
jgi:hypothetical protein